MRVARMGYAQRVVKKDNKGRVTQSFMRVRIEVSDPIISALLPKPYTGLRHLTKKVATEREHAEWTARFLSMIEDAKAVLDPSKKPTGYVRVPLAPLTTEKRIIITSVQRGGFGSRFVAENEAATILAEQDAQRRESEAALPELPPDWPYVGRPEAASQAQPEAVSSPPPPKSSAALKSTDPVPFEAVVSLWARERKILPPGDRQMLSKANRLAWFLGHDDMGRVSRDEMIRYKEDMLKPESGFSHRNIKNHWSDLKTLFKFAAENRDIANPMEGLSFKYNRRGLKPRRSYTDQEAKHILTSARQANRAIRWLQWLAAYTGSRVGEVAECTTLDIRRMGTGWVIDILLDNRDPNASLKTEASHRTVPLHAALIEEGFLDLRCRD
jgi:hypothetical protein